jgi:glutamate/tyrosine decarboxylase-like PLP-dependent enzyme
VPRWNRSDLAVPARRERHGESSLDGFKPLLAELVEAHQDLELLAGPGLSICCFRHVPAGMAEAELDAHNARLLETLQRDGRVYLSNATVDGRLALRACITNFRTTRADAERTVDIVRELGASLATARGSAS